MSKRKILKAEEKLRRLVADAGGAYAATIVLKRSDDKYDIQVRGVSCLDDFTYADTAEHGAGVCRRGIGPDSPRRVMVGNKPKEQTNE